MLFNFILKARFVLKIFKFLSWLLGQVEKRLDQKDKVNFKIYDVATWLTLLTPIHILTNISRTKGNQTMKFGQLIEYNMRIIFFLKNHTENVVEKLFPDLFLQNQNWAYLWINSLKSYTACFYCMPSWDLSKYIES